MTHKIGADGKAICTNFVLLYIILSSYIRDLQKIIDPKNMAAGFARRHIFVFILIVFFLEFPLYQIYW
ncbi:MAG: hypothetical protein DCF20_13875, partial [Pseudanabaena sp.]